MAGELFDKRSEFFKSYFEKALTFEEIVKTGTAPQNQKWLNFSASLQLTNEQKTLLSSFKRKMHVLVLSGIWCGDCARQCPMLDLIAKNTSVIDLRFIDNQSNPELRDEMRISGGSRVPAVIVLSEDFFEIARFGDRHLSVYRRKAMNELGAACDAGILPPPADELALELREWLEFIERAQLLLRMSGFLRKRHND